MNTRLQVEHPVTELVYGQDLVEWQLRVAAGEPLTLRQEQLIPHGHAVEARLYAEDPAGGFLPVTGTVRRYREPSGVRVDSAIREGTEVGTAYDPMLAKVIAHGSNRDQAFDRLECGLGDLQLLGVTTNAVFTRAMLARPDVRRGDQDTGLLERVLGDFDGSVPDDLLPTAALAAAGTANPNGPWRRVFDAGEVRIQAGSVRHGDRLWTAAVHRLGDRSATIELDGVVRHYATAAEDDTIWISRDAFQLEVRTFRADRTGAGHGAGSLEAPMPGTVLQVNVSDGDHVAAGEVLLIIESMKMELSISAPWNSGWHGPAPVAGPVRANATPVAASSWFATAWNACVIPAPRSWSCRPWRRRISMTARRRARGSSPASGRCTDAVA
jgi:acetyl-CoA/propionyl-CoA carboxylase, biotin carboxylase, biotin carboxyl carrier protein